MPAWKPQNMMGVKLVIAIVLLLNWRNVRSAREAGEQKDLILVGQGNLLATLIEQNKAMGVQMVEQCEKIIEHTSAVHAGQSTVQQATIDRLTDRIGEQAIGFSRTAAMSELTKSRKNGPSPLPAALFNVPESDGNGHSHDENQHDHAGQHTVSNVLL